MRSAQRMAGDGKAATGPRLTPSLPPGPRQHGDGRLPPYHGYGIGLEAAQARTVTPPNFSLLSLGVAQRHGHRMAALPQNLPRFQRPRTALRMA